MRTPITLPRLTGSRVPANNGATTVMRDDLIARALQSTRPPHVEYIDVVYRALLGRNADPDGLATYTRLIQDHGNPDCLVQMIASIASSDEARAHRHNVD